MTSEKQLRGKLIKLALNRATRAFRAGFYLETLALCDSLITDRVSKIAQFSLDIPLRIRGVNDGVAKLEQSGLAFFDTALPQDTRAWGKQRNSAIHGFTKFDEFSGSGWRARIAAIQKPASEGIALANRWLTEASKHRL